MTRSGGRPIDLQTFVSTYLGPIVIGLGVAILVLLLAILLLLRRTSRLGRRLASLTQGSDAQSLEAVLGSHIDRVRKVVSDLDRVEARIAMVERDLQATFGRVGIVRFNPFEETGGNQSFALALLDGRGDGFVVSSLHARAGTRVYAKAIAKGASETALSTEESEALRIALAKPVPGAAG
ncbi:MAG TPA: DUF4446 family protein [Candidatus Limnocylindrales bacterium]|nr:DUF4446 family protein [Candidatus Limnocylindrales bacterium]